MMLADLMPCITSAVSVRLDDERGEPKNDRVAIAAHGKDRSCPQDHNRCAETERLEGRFDNASDVCDCFEVFLCFFAEALADDAAEVRRIVDAAGAGIVRHGRIRAQRTRAIDLAVGDV